MAYSIDDFNNLRQAIVTQITADETTIQEAYFAPQSEFEGFPAAVIGISPNEALYNSTAVDRMTLPFAIQIYIPLGENDDAVLVEQNMGKAYWEVLHMFNQRDVLNPYADIVEPVPSVWDYVEIGAGIYRMCEVNLRCIKYISNERQLT